jgi:hypothetical protein
MVAINMPGGAIQEIENDELLWFRKAFGSEWSGATMLLLTTNPIYSIESIPDLIDKFSAAKIRLAEFTAPDAELMLVVSAKKVQRIIESNPAIYHEGARSVLVFSNKLRLAVRETPEEVRQKIKSAKNSVIVADATVRAHAGTFGSA